MALDVVPPLSAQPRPHSKGRRPCSCCPYGYHIDLDFVRYCESITNSQLMPTVTSRRSKWNNVRRKRASREALLGLVLHNSEKCTPDSLTHVSPDVGDDLHKAVLDFEKTLKHASLPRTKNKKDWASLDAHESVYSLPRNHTFHGSLLSSPSPLSSSKSEREGGNRILSIEEMLFSNSDNASAETLQAIRKQMAASLQRMKELEEQIKTIPALREEISSLRLEKRQLLDELTDLKSAPKAPPPPPKADKTSSTRDLVHSRAVGVGCTVLTREVGVSSQIARSRTVGVGTDTELRTRPDGVESVSLDKIIGCTSSATSTESKEEQVPVPFQRTSKWAESPPRQSPDLQSAERKELKSVAASTELTARDIFTEDEINRRIEEIRRKTAPPPKVTRGSNTELIASDIFTQIDVKKQIAFEVADLEWELLRATVPKAVKHASVQTSNRANLKHSGTQVTPKVLDVGSLAKAKSSTASQQTSVSVRSVGVPDGGASAVFSCDKCKMKKVSVGTCYPERSESSSSSQRVPFNSEMTVAKKKSASKTTDTHDLRRTHDVSSNTPKKKLVSTAVETGDLVCRKCSTGEVTKPAGNPVPAKRPSYLPISVNRVKSGSTPSPLSQPLQHEGSNSDSGSDDGTYTIHQDFGAGMRDDPSYDQSLKYQDYVRREPSKEMRGAMKVLNDALLKSPNGDIPKHVKTAVNIVQQEWFKVSSVASANPLDVEYYLDCFEEISATLLQYVVNMTDVSGNTAMHYAVSNGNFDVVSILLDSKVCNINKLNTAGYTCIMLVALTKVKSETDREVVRRLFNLADVNIRAKEHGQTALMLAVSHGRIDTVELLLEAGADINIQDEDGSTALMCAAEHGYIEIVKLLLAQPDCDLGITDNDGTTALAIAMEAGNRDIGVLLYAQEHFSRGSSPYTSLKHKRAKSTTPTLKSRPTTPSHSSHRKDFEVES